MIHGHVRREVREVHRRSAQDRVQLSHQGLHGGVQAYRRLRKEVHRQEQGERRTALFRESETEGQRAGPYVSRGQEPDRRDQETFVALQLHSFSDFLTR